jgi:hypothetical protein
VYCANVKNLLIIESNLYVLSGKAHFLSEQRLADRSLSFISPKRQTAKQWILFDETFLLRSGPLDCTLLL